MGVCAHSMQFWFMAVEKQVERIAKKRSVDPQHFLAEMRFYLFGDGRWAGQDEVYAIRAGGPRVCHGLYDDGIQTPVQNPRPVVPLMKPSVQNGMWMHTFECLLHLGQRQMTNLQKPFP